MTAARDRTLPGLLSRRAVAHRDEVALRQKRRGIWREITWGEYASQVAATARALSRAGVGPGDHVAILSGNRVEWLVSDLAAQSLGAVSVGLHHDDSPAQLRRVFEETRPAAVFCEGEEEIATVQALVDPAHPPRRVVVYEPRAARGAAAGEVVAWPDLPTAAERRSETRDWWSFLVGRADPDCPALLVSSSGSGGPPRVSALSGSNAAAGARATAGALGLGPGDTLFSHLPLCHPLERAVSIAAPLAAGAVVHFGESSATVPADLREVAPTVLAAVPRVWQAMAAAVALRADEAGWLGRSLLDSFSRRCREIAPRRQAGKSSLTDSTMWRLGNLLVLRAVRARLGLTRCRLAVSAGAPLSPEVQRWFAGLGVDIVEAYCLAPVAGLTHVDRSGELRAGTVGEAVAGIEWRIGERDEVLLRGPAVGPPVDAGNWLHTGDHGAVAVDGALTLTEQIDEVIEVEGPSISLRRAAAALEASDFVREALVLWRAGTGMIALVQIEHEVARRWARRQGVHFTSHADLVSRPELVAAVAVEVEAANRVLDEAERVRAFRLLPRDPSPQMGEVSPGQRMRRVVIEQSFADLIASIER